MYLDDIIIYCKDLETHVKQVAEILGKLQTAGFSLKLKKCHFFQ